MLPGKQKTYLDVFRIACQDFLAANPEDRFAKGGFAISGEAGLLSGSAPFFDETITVEVSGFRFRSSKGSNVTLATKIITLHYLNTATGAPLTGRRIAYEDVPALRHYTPVFERRVAKPLQRAFGIEPHAFLEAGEALGATAEAFGDAAFTLFALPRLPVTFILWAADDEFPPSLKVLYDDTVTSYLPLEDITVMTKLAGTRLLKAARHLYAGDSWPE